MDRRILVVDDDSDIREAFETALQAEGALTMAAADGNEAIRIVSEDPPELVVLDMMLPKRSGFLVLEKIKGYDESPAVIMVTANEGKRHEAYAQNLGADCYLQKPVPLSKLIATAVMLLAKRDEALGVEEGDEDGDEGGDEGGDEEGDEKGGKEGDGKPEQDDESAKP